MTAPPSPIFANLRKLVIHKISKCKIVIVVRYERWTSWKSSTPEQKIRNATKVNFCMFFFLNFVEVDFGISALSRLKIYKKSAGVYIFKYPSPLPPRGKWFLEIIWGEKIGHEKASFFVIFIFLTQKSDYFPQFSK